jgi:hypothetical protein
LRAGFLNEAAKAAGRIHVINGGRDPEQVRADIWRIAAGVLGLA